MVTRDVFQVLKLHSPAARAISRTFKTSLVPIYHVMHSRSYDFLLFIATARWLLACWICSALVGKDHTENPRRLLDAFICRGVLLMCDVRCPLESQGIFAIQSISFSSSLLSALAAFGLFQFPRWRRCFTFPSSTNLD